MEAGALTPPSTGPDLLITEFGGPTTVLADKDCISEEAFLRELDLDAFAYTGLGIFPDWCSAAWAGKDLGVFKILSRLGSAPWEATEEGGRWDLWEEDWTEDDAGKTPDDGTGL